MEYQIIKYEGDFMKKVGLVVDNSGVLSKKNIEQANVFDVCPVPFIINGEEYFENKNLSYEQFYEFLKDKTVNISTSQPSIETVKAIWREALKNYDEIVYILLSSGLSESCNTSLNASHEQEFEGKVFVVNNQRVSYMNKASMLQAGELIKQGKSALEIKNYLEETRGDCAAFIAVDTLKYLKKGGRITPAAAAIGTLLNIKPILSVRSGKLDAHAKCMSMKMAKSKILQTIRKEVEEKFAEELKNGQVYLAIAHTNPDKNSQDLLDFKQEILEHFPDMKFFTVDPLPLFVACHTGPNALAAGYVIDKLNILDKYAD